MGAPIWILVVLIALAMAAWLLWTLFAAGRAAAGLGEGTTGETAAHSAEHTDERTVHYTADDVTGGTSAQPDDDRSNGDRTDDDHGDVRKPADPDHRDPNSCPTSDVLRKRVRSCDSCLGTARAAGTPDGSSEQQHRAVPILDGDVVSSEGS